MRVYAKEDGAGGYVFYADNDLIIPAWVKVSFASLTNLTADAPLPWSGAVAPGTRELRLFALQAPSLEVSRGYRLSYTFAKGDPSTARPDPDYLYLFPWQHGVKHQLTQGFNGTFTHFADNQYALDFNLDIGAPVHAARDGLVVEVKEDSDRGGASASYNADGNYILVYHSDGTFGNYVHLQKNGALVEPGQMISAGQHIGLSGNTGRSSGPHLHFDVRIPTAEGKMQSVPIRFLNYDGSAIDPRENEFYYASHPGGPAFAVVFGSRLTNADYAAHQLAVPMSGKINFREEQIDLTWVVFIQNGFEERYEVTVTLNLGGMTSTIPSPIKVVIPARTEIFLTILRPRPGTTSWRYGYSYRYKPVP